MHHGHSHDDTGGHQHGMYFDVPMMPSGQCSRQTCARIISPIALFLIFFVGYTIFAFIFNVNLQSTHIPNDAICFLIIWLLLVISFLRGAFSSPGVVDKNWFKKYPDIYETIRNEYLRQQELMKRQQAMMKQANNNNNNNTNTNDNNNTNDNTTNNNNNNQTTINMEHGQNDENERFIDVPEHLLRPPRSHYCHELQANVLRMDHYCVWFNNAVGLNNYKYFILTLFYLLLYCMACDVVIIYRSFINPYSSMQTAIGEMTTFQTIWRVFCLIIVVLLSIIFTIFSAMHLYFHFWQLSKGLTSIEYHRWSQMRAMGYHLGVPFHNTHEFDYGYWDNCERMLGKDWFLWCLPTNPWLVEDGYKYEINNKNRQVMMEYGQKIHKKRQEIWQKQGLLANK